MRLRLEVGKYKTWKVQDQSGKSLILIGFF